MGQILRVWTAEHAILVLLGAAATFAMSAIMGMLVMRRIAVMLREPIEIAPTPASASLKARFVRMGRNLAALALILVGTTLLVLPGEGVLTIVLGLLLLDHPGRDRLLHRMAGSHSLKLMIARLSHNQKAHTQT